MTGKHANTDYRQPREPGLMIPGPASLAPTGDRFPSEWVIDFVGMRIRLQLHALAYNLRNFMRTLALPDAVK